MREYLGALTDGLLPANADPSTWSVLALHKTVEGTPQQPRITAAGRHVLKELSVRAARTDPLPLLDVAAELDRVQGVLDEVARVAEDFISDLGPVVPIEVLALLKPVAVNLATRRQAPEELSENFRDAWGAIEVLTGSPEDKLLAAELLEATGTSLETSYSELSSLNDRIRESAGSHLATVTPAALLLGRSPPIPVAAAIERYLAIRGQVQDAIGAALLARSPSLPGGGSASERWREFLKLLRPVVQGDEEDLRRAAVYLTAVGAEPQRVIPRVQSLARLLSERFRSPALAAALLTRLDRLGDDEIMDWFDKAHRFVQTRRLASTPDELNALALGLLPGIQDSTFLGTSIPSGSLPIVPAIVTLHAWVFRPLVRRTAGAPMQPN